MLENQGICFGCCLGLQSLARATDFDNDPYRGLFDDVAKETRVSVASLRQICLTHQQEIVAEKLKDPRYLADREGLLELAYRLSEALQDAHR
jgi:hypothetical protein